MKRKNLPKKPYTPKNKPSFVFSLSVLAIFFTGFFGLITVVKWSSAVHVLGAQTILLARETNSQEGETRGEVRKIEIVSEKIEDTDDSKKEKEENITEETLVDCEGVDGKHSLVSLTTCKKVHEEMKSKQFSFTPLTKLTKEKNLTEGGVKQSSSSAHKSEKQEKKEEQEIPLEKRVDQSQKRHDTSLTLETDSNNRSILSRKNSKAVSDLPISVDKEKNTIHVTTEAGEQEIHVFPDKAVESILEAKLLTNTETEISSESGESTKKVVLTEVNSMPAFAINGVSEKKVLGVFPVAFSKTIFVSAVDGTVVKTDETILNKLLESLSF